MSFDTDVVIVGGGGCGLSLSCFLSDMGISHYLFERHSTTSNLPKSHFQNQRTMEIFRQHGIEPQIATAGAPERFVSRVRWMTSLGGEDEFNRKVLASLRAFGGGERPGDPNVYTDDGPVIPRNLPQIRLEPILHKIAADRNPKQVLFSHNVTGISPSADAVEVTVKNSNGDLFKIRSRYLVAADGGKTIGPKVDIEMDGIGGFAHIVTTHFKADLSAYWEDPDFLVNFAGINGDGGLLPMGPTWGKHSEEWIIHQTYSLDQEPNTEKSHVVDQIRKLINLPELQIEVLQITMWIPERLLADRYRNGRVFIAGDAAHKHPPTTGLGLNGGIADSHNLAWKLALVIRGVAHDRLLDTYELERRPVAKRNCDWAMMTFVNREVLGKAIGLVRGDMIRNAWRLSVLFEDSLSGIASRDVLQRNIDVQATEFSAHDLELGYTYEVGAIVSDGTEAPKRDPSGQKYNASTRPGHRLPHSWLTDKNSNTVSTHDLVGSNAGFVLITDSAGIGWDRPAREAAKQFGVQMNIVTIDTEKTSTTASYADNSGRWKLLSQVEPGGAIIIRPDNTVGWRSVRAPQEGVQLVQELGAIIGRPGKQAKM